MQTGSLGTLAKVDTEVDTKEVNSRNKFQTSESGSIGMKPPQPLTGGSVVHLRTQFCYNDPAGVSVSPPTDDAICILASATATAEPDSRNAVEEENCACGTLGLLERFGRPERRAE
ncbi:hypothetical protein EYF80_000411 [Liparis tanakae]|uniref:Uncharacterized protein n=1 Tax=Liparis tanakae TaxID=230148 RepID=A0A4Z2JGY5_9TELE|nr:hypothetical protein EYF80_000411 [Liparis tanakae]